MKQPKGRKTILAAVYFTPKEYELMLKGAKKMDLSISDFCRKVILMGMDDYRLLETVGVVSVAKAMRHTMDFYAKQGVLKSGVSGKG